MKDTPGYSGFAGYSRLGRSLWIVVAVLGAASMGVSVGSPAPLGFSVRLSVAAGIIAAVGLLPKQSERGWIVVALAISGFLDAAAAWIALGAPHWTLTVVMVLDALQSGAALGALLHEPTRPVSADADDRRHYSEYVAASAAYQAYAMQYQHASMAQYDAMGQATAWAEADAAGRYVNDAQGDATHDSNVALHARYVQYRTSDSRPDSPGTSDTRLAGPDTGLPAGNHASPQPYPYQGQYDFGRRAAPAPPDPIERKIGTH